MSATPFYPPGFRATDADDNPLAGGYYLFFAAGTSTPKAVYSDAALATSLGTTVDLNIAGAPVSDSNVPVLVYPATGAYKIEIYSSADALLFTFDDIPGAEEAADPIVSSLPDTPVLSRTSTFSVTVDNRGTLFNLNPTGGSFAATLPSAVAAGDKFRVGFRHNGTANTATILTTLSQTIRRHKNSTSWTLKSQGECLWLVSDGSDWSVDAYTPPLMDGATPFFTVTDRLTAPPSSPTGGARYIVNGTPTGVWLTLGFAEHDVAEADGNGSWIKYTPVEGWFAYVTDENLYTAFVATAWADQTGMAAAQSSVLQTAVFEHQETNGTVGGMATDGAWTKRTLNTSVQNDITGVSLATSQITLPVGKYLIDFSQHLWSSDQSPTYGDQDSRIKVISGTATPDPIKGIAGENDSGVVGSSLVTVINAPFHSARGILTVTAEAVIELQYFHNNAGVSTAELGTASSEADAGVEMYARVVIMSLTALQGIQGIQGIQGLEGLDAAYAYQWSTLTSGDPGTGKIRGNNATPASITEIAVHQTDAVGADLTNVIASWDDSSSTTSKARVRIQKEGATQNFHEFRITAAGTDQGDYWTFPVTFIATGGTIVNADDCAVNVLQVGDIGDPGTTVPDFSGLTALTGADRVAADLIGVYDSDAAALKSMTVTEFFNAIPVTIVSAATSVLSGTAANASIELGAPNSGNTPFIDFHSSGNAVDHDFRLIASGGDATLRGGILAAQGSFAISPRAASLKTGLTITQTPTGATGGGLLNFNSISVTSTDLDGGAGSSKNNGLFVEHIFGGSSTRGGQRGMEVYGVLNAATHASNPDRNYAAAVFTGAAYASDGGGSGTEKGAIFGIGANGAALSGAINLLNVTAAELNTSCQTGSSVKYKSILQLVGRNDDAVQGSETDAMLSLSNQSGAVKWERGILFGDQNGEFPLDASATLLGSDAGSIANGIDLSALTIATSAFKSTGFDVAGTGAVSASLAGTPASFANTTDAATNIGLEIQSDRATPAANDRVALSFKLSDSAGNQDEFGRIEVLGSVVTSASESGNMRFHVISSGSLLHEATLSATSWSPAANGGSALGTTGIGWNGLNLATLTAINWANGEITLTPSDANTLVLAGAATEFDVQGPFRADSLRIDQAASTVGTGAKTISNAADGSTNFGKYFSLNLNGTTVYVPCGTVAPT